MHATVAYARNPSKIPEDIASNPDLEIIAGEIHDLAALSQAVAQSSVILSLLGPNLHERGITPALLADYYQSSVFPLMRQNGVRRIFAMGTLSIVRPEDHQTFLRPMAALFVRLIANTAYQNVLNIAAVFDHEAHDIDWTVFRIAHIPGNSDHASWKTDRDVEAFVGWIGENGWTGSQTRGALARWLVDAAESGMTEWVGKMSATLRPLEEPGLFGDLSTLLHPIDLEAIMPKMRQGGSSGCWACRPRRKKCDKSRPICGNCRSLEITCNFAVRSPEWMDNGPRQRDMTKQLKNEVKKSARRRRQKKLSGAIERDLDEDMGESQQAPQGSVPDQPPPTSRAPDVGLLPYSTNMQLDVRFDREGLDLQDSSATNANTASEGLGNELELSLFMAYLDYDQLHAQTNMAIKNVQLDIHQISHWDNPGDPTERAHLLVSIVQLLTLSSVDSVRRDLDAASVVFGQISQHHGRAWSSSGKIAGILDQLHDPSFVASPSQISPWNSSQAAFCFSSAMLLLYDIIASISLEQPPRLAEYHAELLINNVNPQGDPTLDLTGFIGCHNWALVFIGEVVSLHKWKKYMKKRDTLSMLQLAQRANQIDRQLQDGLDQLQNLEVAQCRSHNPKRTRQGLGLPLFGIFNDLPDESNLTANPEVRDSVARIVDLLTKVVSPAVLRTLALPFCVAGCLAGED
ncbi:uncharacterized protein KD926_003434 [Aspergillus affinis]|uniref:uncharacterized protein n=1 Tax=Aspergillus affinis TaxID=1070780 RepID=UPI0022FE34CD|nr:uncharacterized protein KD926_003434 [Aspergillus affinis]KAI9035506.1 hypothetical protein KD926_003434 [Aspergillus affinis]